MNNYINEKELDLLHDLMTGKISVDDFKTEFSPEINLNYILTLLSCSKVNNDKNLFRNVLWGIGMFLSSKEKLTIYRFLLLDSWHSEHEELLMALQVTYKEEEGNSYFINALIHNLPDYVLRDEDLSDSFINKCLYALKAQIEPDSKKIIMELSNSTKAALRDKARAHLI